MKNKYDGPIKDKVCEDIRNGMSIEEAVKKYGVSMYYARLWTNIIYKQMDLDTFVRRRYKWIAVEARESLETLLGKAMTEDEQQMLSEETWDKWDEIIKLKLYEFAKNIVRAN